MDRSCKKKVKNKQLFFLSLLTTYNSITQMKTDSMNFENNNQDDDELYSLMQQHDNEEENASIPIETGRSHPLPHDANKHFAWEIYKPKKNKGRRLTCRNELCSHFNQPPPPPPPPPAPVIMAYGGKIKKRNMKKTKKNKYSKKIKSSKCKKKTRKCK
jgi:hypothetical protein